MTVYILLLSSDLHAFSPYSYPQLLKKLEFASEYRSLRLTDNAPSLPSTVYQQVSSGSIVTGVDDSVGWGAAAGASVPPDADCCSD